MSFLGFPTKFDKDVASIISLFLTPKSYKILDWIDQKKLDWLYLSEWVDESVLYDHQDQFADVELFFIYGNENAPNFIEDKLKNYSKLNSLDFLRLCSNKSIVHLLQKNKQHLSWISLCANENGIPLLNELTNGFTTNLDKISWIQLCLNPNAIPIIETIIEKQPNMKNKLSWRYLCENPKAIPILEKNKTHIYWFHLSKNENAIHLLSESEEVKKINWKHLCANKNAIPLIEKLTNNLTTNIYKINWKSICRNPNAIDLLTHFTKNFTKNLQVVYWEILSSNPNAIPILKQRRRIKKNYVHYAALSMNRGIIELNFERYQTWLNYITHSVYNL